MLSGYSELPVGVSVSVSVSGEACPECNLLPSCPPYVNCCTPPPPATLHTKNKLKTMDGRKKPNKQTNKKEYLLIALSNLID